MNIGDKIKNLRIQNKLTQEQLATRLFVSRTAISKWERNGGYPNIDSLKLIAEVFSITLDELLSNEEIIMMAKEEKKNAISNLTELFVAIIDIISLILIFLPLYGLTEGNYINSVNLFASDCLLFIKITSLVLICALTVCGIIQLIFHFLNNTKLTAIIKWVSICFWSLLMLVFIISLEPYAAVLSFIFLGLKVGLISKFKK